MLLFSYTTEHHCNPSRTRHVHDDIEVLSVRRGSGLQLTVQGEEPCRPGDVFVFPVGCRHMSAGEPGDVFTSTVMNALPSDLPGEAGSLLAAIARRAESANRLPVRPSTGQRVAGVLDRAAHEWASPALGARSAAIAMVMEAVVALARDLEQAPPVAAAGEQHVAMAVRWLEDYWMSEVAVADLVALGTLGRSQFLARFRAVTGVTVGDMLLRIRLREAQRMMRDGRNNLLEVSLGCGFGSQSHFNHRFKHATGLSPRAWLAWERRLQPAGAMVMHPNSRLKPALPGSPTR